jgi:hypothetical protein
MEFHFELLAILAAAVLALVGHWVQTFLSHREHNRQAEIKRLGDQIEGFFGPLSGCLQRTAEGFNCLVLRYAWAKGIIDDVEVDKVEALMKDLEEIEQSPECWPKGPVSEYGHTPSERTFQSDLLELWCDFVDNVALPAYQTMVTLMAERAHLFDGPYPKCFVTVFSLVAERQVMVADWRRGQYDNLRGSVRFPSDVDKLVKERLRAFTRKKAELEGALVDEIEADEIEALVTADEIEADVEQGNTRQLRKETLVKEIPREYRSPTSKKKVRDPVVACDGDTESGTPWNL